MRYCSQCGRPVRDGEICSCQGGNAGQRSAVGKHPGAGLPGGVQGGCHPTGRGVQEGYYQSGGANGAKRTSSEIQSNSYSVESSSYRMPIQKGIESDDHSYRNDIPQSKPFWQHLLSLFTKPVEEIQDMILAGDNMIGIKLLLVNIALTVVAVAIMTALLQNAASGLFGNILGRAGIITGIIAIIGNLLICSALTALLLLFSKTVFHAQTTFAEIFTIVESKAVLDGAFLLLYAILCSVSANLAALVFILGQVYAFLVMILGYAEVIELEGSKKVFSLLLTFVSIIIILYLLVLSAEKAVKKTVENNVEDQINNSIDSLNQYFESDFYDDYDE